jgi:hypothetical protein
MKPLTRTIAHQPSWIVRTKEVELAVTQLGGHMAPVTFYRNTSRPIQPYYINPWHGERDQPAEPVLKPLRGDFFCMPFGSPDEFAKRFPATHGDPACEKWSLAGMEKRGDVTTLVLRMKGRRISGTYTKCLMLVDGQQVVYDQHVLEGFSGSFPIGHHATLAMPQDDRTVLVATSPMRAGMTNPVDTGDPAGGRYQSVATNHRFTSLSRVPLVWRTPSHGDCSSFPTRRGFTDIVGVIQKPSILPAWTAATYTTEGFLWFSLKDASVLPMMMMWIANCGRHVPPWNGRERCLGLEDVRAFFTAGTAGSARPNALRRMGVPTAMKFTPGLPVAVNYIQGVIKTPPGFGRVKTARFEAGKVTFISESGKKASAAVRHEFLATGEV